MNPWLISALQSTFEGLSGAACTSDAPRDCQFRWRQPFSGIPGAIWIASNDGPTLEAVKESLSGIERAFSELFGRDVRGESGEAQLTLPTQMCWLAFEPGNFYIGVEADLSKAIPAPRETSKTFDLLMDVELPVSVSFGRAQVALKDVLKLTTGSIVELNRAIGDPVEVIVNNCVIARGEVVTIEGNFGVRIQQVISRQERLRTLK